MTIKIIIDRIYMQYRTRYRIKINSSSPPRTADAAAAAGGPVGVGGAGEAALDPPEGSPVSPPPPPPPQSPHRLSVAAGTAERVLRLDAADWFHLPTMPACKWVRPSVRRFVVGLVGWLAGCLGWGVFVFLVRCARVVGWVRGSER